MDFSDPEILGCTQFNTLLVGFNFRRLHIENFEARSSHYTVEMDDCIEYNCCSVIYLFSTTNICRILLCTIAVYCVG